MNDHTIRIAIMRALGYNDKLPVWEVSPWTGRYEATPSTWTDGDYNSALADSNGRLIVKAILDSVTGGVTLDVSDRAARLLGLVYGSRNAQLQQKATTFELLTYDSFITTLLGGGLPAALDGLSLKVKEQSPITTINIGNYPASYAVTATDLDIRDLTTTERTPLGSESVALKQIATSNELSVKESTPLTGFATSTFQTTGNNSLGTIKTNTDPLVAAAAGGYIRQDSTATIAKESGGNLATVKTNTDSMLTALQIIDDMDIKKIGGTAQTGKDITALLASWDYATGTQWMETIPHGSQEVPLQQKITTNDLIVTLDSEKVFTRFNMESAVIGQVTNNSHAAGTITLTGTAVPANKVWVITYVRAMNETNACTYEILYLDTTIIKRQKTVAAEVETNFDGTLYLAADDYVKCEFYGTLLNDMLILGYFGYQVDV